MCHPTTSATHKIATTTAHSPVSWEFYSTLIWPPSAFHPSSVAACPFSEPGHPAPKHLRSNMSGFFPGQLMLSFPVCQLWFIFSLAVPENRRFQQSVRRGVEAAVGDHVTSLWSREHSLSLVKGK